MKPQRHWGTWDARRPAEMMHLPSDLRVTPVVYAASTGKASLLPPGSVRLGSHAVDSSLVELGISHAGTALDWRWQKTSPTSLSGEWASLKHGEWGLRFWVSLCLSGAVWKWNGQAAMAKLDDGFAALLPAQKPLLITAHEGPEGFAAEMEAHGYWYLSSRATQGECLVLRFNLDEMPACRFALGTGKSEGAALRAARLSLAEPRSGVPEEDALAAMRDIVAWNSTWDPVNKRPYTSCTRNWDTGKFGGFGIWLTDTAINALMLSAFDAEMAAENLAALRAHQTKAGNFPCLVTGHDAWPDRSQPPIISFILWQIYLRDGDKGWLKENYEALARNHAWWWKNRDGNGNGILEYGSSDVGTGLYVGTKLAAKDESFMDNSPMHDEARWNEASRTLDMEDVGLNSLMALDAEMLGNIARALGKAKQAEAHEKVAQAQRARVREHFWDAKRKCFANRLWSGKFADAITPTSFYPLLCGAAGKAQVKAMLKLLKSPAHFGGEFGLPSVARAHPSFKDDVYWRGRVWPILNWLVWLGLKRQGELAEAEKLLKKSGKLFSQSWKHRKAPENFNADTGNPSGPDTDDFYSWTALLAAMQVSSLIDIDPWQGWVCVNEGPDASLGPMRSPWGLIHAERRKGRFRITNEAGEMLFETRRKGRIKADCRG